MVLLHYSLLLQYSLKNGTVVLRCVIITICYSIVFLIAIQYRLFVIKFFSQYFYSISLLFFTANGIDCKRSGSPCSTIDQVRFQVYILVVQYNVSRSELFTLHHYAHVFRVNSCLKNIKKGFQPVSALQRVPVMLANRTCHSAIRTFSSF